MAAEGKKPIVKIKLNQSRETKGTYVYATSEPSHVDNVYIKKNAFIGRTAPLAVMLIIEEA
jgi:hypothetical protein